MSATKNSDPALSLTLGRLNDDPAKAYRCFVLARAPEELASTVEKLQSVLLKGEYDLFVARSSFELMALRAVDEAGLFLEHFREVPGLDSPILRFARFLCAALGEGSQTLFRFLLVKYETSIRRDPGLGLYLSRLSKVFFGEALSEETSTVGSVLKELFT